jgi:GntR family transcriptional regulator
MLAAFPGSASDARLPRYQQLRDAVTSQITAGVWKPGDAIPAEQALAETYGLALGTVRKAIDTLVADGLLERRQGKGTFVRRAEFSSSLFRFFRFHDEEGRQAIPEGRVLARKRVPASPEAASRLGIALGAPAIRLSRLRLVGGKPLLAEDIWLPADRFAALMELRPSEFSDLLYPLYEELCGQLIASAEESLSIEPVDAANARLLDLDAGAAVVVIERVARSYNHQPLEWRRSRGPADRFHYRVEIR